MRNRSTAATIARALLALVALVALVAGVPAVLLGIGVLPDHVPGVGEITTALTSPDTGQLFLGAVTLIGWYGWISFVISVVLETGAALRHVRAPRIRMLGGSSNWPAPWSAASSSFCPQGRPWPPRPPLRLPLRPLRPRHP